MSKFFKMISGRPKNGNITECLSPIINIIQMAFVGFLFGLANIDKSLYGKFMFFTIATLAIWQIGWGMSLKRFTVYENRLKEIQEGNVKEIIRPYVFGTQLILSIILDLIAISIPMDGLKYTIYFLSMFLAWQSGWGMSIVRERDTEKSKINNNDI